MVDVMQKPKKQEKNNKYNGGRMNFRMQSVDACDVTWQDHELSKICLMENTCRIRAEMSVEPRMNYGGTRG